MRRRRALIFDDEPVILEMVEMLLTARDYEVHAFSRPVVCPIFQNNEQPCRAEKPCADVIITDFNMPVMNGVELLMAQKERGCRLDIRNKAIMSGYVTDESMNINQLGCAFFNKPFRPDQLWAWLDECEERMPLSVLLPIPRREKRRSILENITYSLFSGSPNLSGIVTDISNSGFCLKTEQDLPERAVVHVHSDLPLAADTATVRWIRRDVSAPSFYAGLSFC